jgi:hypothetical protein
MRELLDHDLLSASLEGCAEAMSRKDFDEAFDWLACHDARFVVNLWSLVKAQGDEQVREARLDLLSSFESYFSYRDEMLAEARRDALRMAGEPWEHG